MSANDDVRTWIVASVDGRRLLGRMNPESPGFLHLARVVHHGDVPRPLRLEEAFELVVFEAVDPRTNALTRTTMVLVFDFAADGVPMITSPSSLYRCADLTPEDQRTYARFVAQGREHAAKGKAARAGVTLATGLPR